MSTLRARINCVTAWPRTTVVLVLAGISAICYAGGREEHRGHAGRPIRGPGVSNHPVHVVPSADIEVPEGWPVDTNGSITCLTCHAALPSPREKSGPKLRDFDGHREDPTAFCMKCHTGQDRSSAAAMHWAAVGVAHVMPDSRRDRRSGGLLDSESRRCLACHDGVNATESQNMTGGNRRGGYIGNRTGNHPVGVRYPKGARRGSGAAMRPASLLPKEVRLPGGMVSCVSCHDLYARERHLLTVPLDGSALCFTCHDMD